MQQIDPQFVRYLTSQWLFIKRSWASYAQAGLVHFGNTTNNRVENANLRLKKVTHASDRLELAVRKVWNLSEVLLKEFQMQATYYCDRHQVFRGNAYVQRLVSRLTTYAATLVMRNIPHDIRAVYSYVAEGEVCHFGSIHFCSFPFSMLTRSSELMS